jgi:SAM-dependent MidA family methyltransferase
MNSQNYPNSSALHQIICDRIINSPQQRINFAEYMDLLLYHPQYGYYSSGTVVIGAKGDFFTASSLGKDFGELLAIQFLEMWQNLNCPTPFYLVEMGAGNGNLALDILNYLQINYCEFFQALKYLIIEEAVALRKQQQKLLAAYANQVTWKSWQYIQDNSLSGCCFSNELVDAFPVHQITIDRGKIQEVYVTKKENQLVEIVDEISTPKLLDYFDLVEIDFTNNNYPDGYRSEVNLAALDWLKTVASKLKTGYLLTIDYGYPANKYYHPQRAQGTLQCYYQHRRHNNPYVNLGYQDLTAQVDFTALERQGELVGLNKIGLTQQAMFLMALGLGDRLAELSSGKYNTREVLQRRDALHQLIDPMGLGGFSVLLQGKGLTAKESVLKGLTILPLV